MKLRLPLFEVLLCEMWLFWLPVSSFSCNASCLPEKSWRHKSPFCTLKETPFFSLARWPVETKKKCIPSERFSLKSPTLLQSLQGVQALLFYPCNNFKMWIFLYIICIYFFSCVEVRKRFERFNIFMYNRILYLKQQRLPFSKCRL